MVVYVEDTTMVMEHFVVQWNCEHASAVVVLRMEYLGDIRKIVKAVRSNPTDYIRIIESVCVYISVRFK